jgi:hypothetical protein
MRQQRVLGRHGAADVEGARAERRWGRGLRPASGGCVGRARMASAVRRGRTVVKWGQWPGRRPGTADGWRLGRGGQAFRGRGAAVSGAWVMAVRI